MTRKKRVYKALRAMPNYTLGEDDDTCSIQDILTVLEDYDQALRMMVYQYCTTERAGDEVFDHEFMIAGETAFSVLGIDQGEEVPVGFDGIPW